MFSATTLRPMLATLPATKPGLTLAQYVYEPKYDGIRAIVFVKPGSKGAQARFWSRLGNEKTAQFPEIADAIATWAAAWQEPRVFDGEIVALDEDGRPTGFQRLQSRIHVATPTYRSSKPMLPPDQQPAALILFDYLRDGGADLRALPLTERRQRLDALFADQPPPGDTIRISEQVPGDGRGLYERASREGWEGLVVKLARSPYRDGRRSPEWQKFKITHQDEFLVAGWTEPKGARARLGSLVLGRFDRNKQLVHAGEVGSGFNGAELDRLWALLKPLAVKTSPFAVAPKTLSPAHWVTPALVVQVRYTEVTDDGRLRHPTYLGLRDDKRPAQVVVDEPGDNTVPESKAPTPKARPGKGSTTSAARKRATTGATANKPSARGRTSRGARPDPLLAWRSHADALTAQLDDLETRRKDGKLTLPDGDTLDITNPHKVFWPAAKLTKGDLLRYYARLAPLILPVIAERPLVMKRLPNGVDGQSFYQHRAPDIYPRNVRVEPVPGADVPTMFIGGDLKTLLYMAQLAAISMDPWFSRRDALDEADVVAIDLDPQPGATFAQILDVARWVHDELERLHVPSYPKTSGSEGLHIFIPLPGGSSYETGVLFCQIVATIVATKHPKVATVERMVKRRKDKTIYVDYLQNIPGKTLACAYSARASQFAGVSAPLTWAEVDEGVAPQDFTIKTMEARVESVGDLWEGLRTGKPADLMRALEKLA